MNHLLTIARLELMAASRLKWIRLLTIACALLAAAAAYSAGAANELSGADGFARTTLALMPVALLMIPLAAVVLGVSGQCAEAGGEAFLFAQPITRATVLIGRWIGEVAALGAAIVIGFGVGGVIVATSTGIEGLPIFAFFVAASIALAAVFLSIAAVAAASTDRRVVALGAGIFIWFVFVLLYDGAVLSFAGWLTGTLGGRVLFVSVFGNPADLIRVAMLFVSGTANVLGAAGEAWLRFLGGDARAAAITAAALLAWTAAPLVLATQLLTRRDL
jgi:Cu-processing system permease protein